MRIAFAFIPLAATLLATPASAIALLLPAVQASIGPVEFQPATVEIQQDGGFRGSFSFQACDGSVLPADERLCDGSVLPNDLSVSLLGSVFPYFDLTVSVVDTGAPSLFAVAVFVPISPIAGLADWSLQGTLTVPGNPQVQGSVLPGGTPSGDFIEGTVNGALSVGSLGSLPVAQGVGPVMANFGPTAGIIDCAPLGGCSTMALYMAFTGLGGGQVTTIRGRFDLDPVAPIPLPAPAALLLAGLGLLGLKARRRRA